MVHPVLYCSLYYRNTTILLTKEYQCLDNWMVLLDPGKLIDILCDMANPRS